MNTILKDIQDNLETRNQAFEGMTKAERRIAVAKDVLMMLDAGIFNPRTAYKYVDFSIHSNHLPVTGLDEGLQQPLLELLVADPCCKVCAKGAFFLAKVAGYNHCDARTALTNDEISEEKVDSVPLNMAAAGLQAIATTEHSSR